MGIIGGILLIAVIACIALLASNCNLDWTDDDF